MVTLRVFGIPDLIFWWMLDVRGGLSTNVHLHVVSEGFLFLIIKTPVVEGSESASGWTWALAAVSQLPGNVKG